MNAIPHKDKKCALAPPLDYSHVLVTDSLSLSLSLMSIFYSYSALATLDPLSDRESPISFD